MVGGGFLSKSKMKRSKRVIHHEHCVYFVKQHGEVEPTSTFFIRIYDVLSLTSFLFEHFLSLHVESFKKPGVASTGDILLDSDDLDLLASGRVEDRWDCGDFARSLNSPKAGFVFRVIF